MNDLFLGNDPMEEMGLSLPNIPIPVMDGEIFWTVLKEEGGFKLEQNDLTGHARIINSNKIRLAWGDVEAMQAAFKKLRKPWSKCKKGDILAVQRLGGTYSHYAVYVGSGKIIHYAAPDGDFGKEACIHKADFQAFLENSTSFEVLSFSEDGDRPRHRTINLVENTLLISGCSAFMSMPDFEKYMRKLKGYHIYSPQETVERAESRLGETEYNLAFNNCEHFAIWCKTGIHESTQVEDVLFNILARGLFTRSIVRNPFLA